MWKIFLLTLSVAILSEADEEKKFKITLEKVEIETDPSFATVKAEIRTEDGKTVVDASGNILQEMDSGVFVDISASTESDPGQFKPLLKATDIDFCKYDESNTMAPLLSMFIKDIEKFGNLPLKCPVKKGEFHIKGFNIAEENLPSYIPEARYLIESQIHVKKDGNRHVIYNSKWIALIAKE
ncbi:uncharacterized protein LOC132260868 [Phlebotomus argentipes]|uniref:uncharacterized protein LOC132260868 n=1 Tax=Phlebotomus argentipes TaxID=94469 RepID=UPI0028931BFD|nr:uncharacterized protein LOC132260868 [Phlebotomus argentipes]